MESIKVGKLIQKLRKEQKLTQQELGNMLGVSPKTISKWETGNGLPDISFLKRISEIFNITIEELLEGALNKKRKRNINYKKIIFIIPIFLIIILSVTILTIHHPNQKAEHDNCTVIKTYYIDNIGESNDEKYLYITVHEYQVEGRYTLKLSKLVSGNLKVGNSYEFTFKTSKEYVDSKTDKLFKNSEVINLNYTEKVGNEQINTYHCDLKKDT